MTSMKIEAQDQVLSSDDIELEQPIQVTIGKEIRGIRHKRGLTVSALSVQTNISVGSISKIENGVISPSLATLQTIARSLSVPISAFLQTLEQEFEVFHTRAGQGIELQRLGTQAHHHYELLGTMNSNTSGVVVEPCMITLTEESRRFPKFQHDGVETIYMLEGVVDYRHGSSVFRLEPGDTLFFDARAIHGPVEMLSLPCRYLSIICTTADT